MARQRTIEKRVVSDIRFSQHKRARPGSGSALARPRTCPWETRATSGALGFLKFKGRGSCVSLTGPGSQIFSEH